MMKNIIFAVMLLFIISCDNGIVKRSYLLCTPDLPAIWTEVLGEPLWRFEWISTSGTLKHAISTSKEYKAEIFYESTSPVLAYPYWQNPFVPVGIMKPAGALFPFDANKSKIELSWQGGIDAYFYLELAKQNNPKRLPAEFDWLRFRSLWKESKLNESILNDSWLADWTVIAEKTATTGFSAKQIKPREAENFIITLPASGPWFGTSPFSGSFMLNAGEKTVFRVTDKVDSYFCPGGQLRITAKFFNWIPN
jgi:hypothetical protein